jgi:ion channel-forming bestrophin family protein
MAFSVRIHLSGCASRHDFGLARIGKELAAICAMPTPDPKDWVFSPSNNRIFNAHIRSAERVTPEEWVRRGQGSLRVALSGVDHSRVDH